MGAVSVGCLMVHVAHARELSPGAGRGMCPMGGWRYAHAVVAACGHSCNLEMDDPLSTIFRRKPPEQRSSARSTGSFAYPTAVVTNG